MTRQRRFSESVTRVVTLTPTNTNGGVRSSAGTAEPPEMYRLRAWFVTLPTLIMLFGCTAAVQGTPPTEKGIPSTAETMQSSQAQQLYAGNCQGCHGGATGVS